MAFTLTGTNVLEVTVEGRVDNQTIINILHYRASDPTDTGGSDNWLTEFIDAYRLVMVQMYDAYTVSRYWLRGIDNAALIAAGPPSVWRTMYNVKALDYREGTILDVGTKTAGVGEEYLPTHEAARVAKITGLKARGYFKAGYNRFCPWTQGELQAAHDRWSAAFTTAFNTVLETFRATEIYGQFPHVGNGWNLAVWSPAYFGRIIKPDGGDPMEAAFTVDSYVLRPYVGTQTTRRYKPRGGYRGV